MPNPHNPFPLSAEEENRFLNENRLLPGEINDFLLHMGVLKRT